MTVSRSSQEKPMLAPHHMQELFKEKPELLEQFKKSLSAPRFDRYLRYSDGDDIKAIELYQWNARLSQALYIYIQGWEVCLRNKLHDFLLWKYRAGWPYDEQRAVRQFKAPDKRRLREAKERQERERNTSPVSADAIAADLSAGFWVSLLSNGYDIPFTWRHNLQRIFPNNPTIDRRTAWETCDKLLTLRNRIAHHEPIFHMQLDERRTELESITEAMCAATHAYCEKTCTFKEVWEERPR